jgi:hypothetical protein
MQAPRLFSSTKKFRFRVWAPTKKLVMRLTPLLIEGDGPPGWLAISPPDSDVRIGVIGADRADAESRFAAALARWDEPLAAGAVSDA